MQLWRKLAVAASVSNSPLNRHAKHRPRELNLLSSLELQPFRVLENTFSSIHSNNWTSYALLAYFHVTAINAPEDGRKSWVPLWKVCNLDNVTFIWKFDIHWTLYKRSINMLNRSTANIMFTNFLKRLCNRVCCFKCSSNISTLLLWTWQALHLIGVYDYNNGNWDSSSTTLIP